jgi:hypothetical protein
MQINSSNGLVTGRADGRADVNLGEVVFYNLASYINCSQQVIAFFH